MTGTCPTPDACNAFLRRAFAEHDDAKTVPPDVIHTEPGLARLVWALGPSQMRPGEMVSGPTQMHMADTAAYVAVFTHVGIRPMAVTSSLAIDFLRGARGGTLHATARTAKAGRSLVVVNVEMRTEPDGPVASQATVTYSLSRPEPGDRS